MNTEAEDQKCYTAVNSHVGNKSENILNTVIKKNWNDFEGLLRFILLKLRMETSEYSCLDERAQLIISSVGLFLDLFFSFDGNFGANGFDSGCIRGALRAVGRSNLG